jgi:hypothetical protein
MVKRLLIILSKIYGFVLIRSVSAAEAEKMEQILAR